VLNKSIEKLFDNRIIGAPDLVVEVASPATATYDRHEKLDAYASAGVAEYWIVDPTTRTVELLVLEARLYRSFGNFEGKTRLPSTVISDFPINVERFFAYVGK
jgi:Uma2 family endonuclease